MHIGTLYLYACDHCISLNRCTFVNSNNITMLLVSSTMHISFLHLPGLTGTPCTRQNTCKLCQKCTENNITSPVQKICAIHWPHKHLYFVFHLPCKYHLAPTLRSSHPRCQLQVTSLTSEFTSCEEVQEGRFQDLRLRRMLLIAMV